MDDVDATQAQISRNMLHSGDWVTPRLNGVAYMEKAPLKYWMIAVSFRIFGVHDWAARLPLALGVIFLCWVTYRFAHWAFEERAALYAGLALATCVGLFLFTRILIPDALLTGTITLAIWAWLRLLEPDTEHPRRWSALLGLSLGLGLLLKGLIAVVFPVTAALIYMAITRQLFSGSVWRRMHVGFILIVALLIALPWHVLAAIRNPPYFALALHSGPGEYHGFFWFYFFNEHLLRFLGRRYPRDYNTVPRALFWLLTLVWLFPWSVYLPAACRVSYSPASRAGRARLMALCWIGVVMLFFTFSTTQEYYSMPIYPALALLIGSAVAGEGGWIQIGNRILLASSTLLFIVLGGLLLLVLRIPAPGDISRALTQHPEMYTLSLGHMSDLTLNAFAYLKLPLGLAAIAFGGCALAIWNARDPVRRALLIAASMIIFFQAARLALVRFDSYLGSYPLAQALEHCPPGDLIEADAYYAFSSVFFYTDRTALLWNGRKNNLEYGSYAPDAPDVFIGDAEFASLWAQPRRFYLLIYGTEVSRVQQLAGKDGFYIVAQNAGNYLLTNEPLAETK